MRTGSGTWPHSSISQSRRSGDAWPGKPRHTPAPRILSTHPAHREVPHGEVSRQSVSWQGLQLGRVMGRLARTTEISVDPRRWRKSAEPLQANRQWLREYCFRLILFPGKPWAAGEGSCSAEELTLAARMTGSITPILHVCRRRTPESLQRTLRHWLVFPWPMPTPGSLASKQKGPRKLQNRMLKRKN